MANITTTSNMGLPDWVQPYAQGYLNQAQQVANTPYQQYQGQMVAGFNPYQQQGLDAMAQRAYNGSPVMGAANQQLQDTIQGKSLGGNPYLQQQIDAAQGDVTRQWNNVAKPSWDTAMQKSGSFGNEGVAQANQMAQSDMQRNLGLIDTNLRANNYNTERGYQMQATGMAPQFANQDYTDINNLIGAGQQYQNQQQTELTNQYNQFQQARQYPAQQLDIMGNALARQYGQQGSQTTPGPSGAATAIGGTLTGAALYNLLFGNTGKP